MKMKNDYLRDIKYNTNKYMLRLLPNGDIEIIKMWCVPSIFCEVVRRLEFNDGDVLWNNLKQMFVMWEDLNILDGNE